MNTYVLEHFGDVVGVIIAENSGQVMIRTAAAVNDNIEVDEGGLFEIHIGREGDFGENTTVKVRYASNSIIVEDNDFVLRKTVNYN